jgi:catechol 2,3-dioxygenase-like lactoylglutathione lyase family enzyme
MDWKLELISVPVTDVDRAKAFYVDQVGFVLDHDHRVGDGIRFVQLTPPGSACSIAIGEGLSSSAPGSVQGLQVVVADVQAAHAELVKAGVAVSDVQSSPGDRSSSSTTPTGTGGPCSSSRSGTDPHGLRDPIGAGRCSSADAGRPPRDALGALGRLGRLGRGPGYVVAVPGLGHLTHVEECDWIEPDRVILEHGTSRAFEPGRPEAGYTRFAGWDRRPLLDRFAAVRSVNLQTLGALVEGKDLDRRGSTRRSAR